VSGEKSEEFIFSRSGTGHNFRLGRLLPPLLFVRARLLTQSLRQNRQDHSFYLTIARFALTGDNLYTHAAEVRTSETPRSEMLPKGSLRLELFLYYTNSIRKG
jgi:hypothetical protein